jgi:hypothetical protein
MFIVTNRVTPGSDDPTARCVSVNSNGGAMHPLASPHPISGRPSLYLHLGMTGAIIEVGLCKLNSVSSLQAPGFIHPLNLKYDILVSKYVFKLYLYHYIEKVEDADAVAAAASAVDPLAPVMETKTADARFTGATPGDLPASQGTRFAGFKAW